MNPNNDTPSIRFAGFTDAWEQREFGTDLISIQTGTNKLGSSQGKGTPLLKMGNIQRGYFSLDKIEYLSESDQVEPDNIANYGDFFFNTRNTLELVGKGATWIGESGKYAFNSNIARFKFKDLDTIFFNYLYNTASMIEQVHARAMGTTSVAAIYPQSLKSIEYNVPSMDEQRVIGRFLLEIDTLITLHQRKYDQLVNIKKSMLEKMFPKNGELVPEVRFAGFTDAWEQRRFSELVLIERGGSPRPIEAYITESPDGLNWIKIGDAPAQGKYITKTAEKIRPEGLSKTRVVQPGDLILSNSMSFGRPYIMSISGCIHDGWLLIRNTKEIFDLTFLCQLLGSGQMLEQYSTLAAGSTVNNLNKELVGSAIVKYPTMDEQRRIGAFLERLDDLITLHQRKLERLQNIKKACLEKMFV